MWRYIYTVTDENTAMDFSGTVCTCTFLEGNGLADCYSWAQASTVTPKLNLNRFSTPIGESEDDFLEHTITPRPRGSAPCTSAMVGLTAPGRSATEQVPDRGRASTVWFRSDSSSLESAQSASERSPRAPRTTIAPAMVELTVPGPTFGPARRASSYVPDKRSTVRSGADSDPRTSPGSDGGKAGLPGDRKRRSTEPAYSTEKAEYWC